MVRVALRAPVRPTELPERVEEAVRRFFPDAEVVHGGGEVRAVARDVNPLRRRVWELRILDAFRGQALRGVDGQRLRLRLSKQAAYLGRVSFQPGRPHALGDLEVEVHVEEGDPWPDAEAFLWWFAPETREGEVVGDVEPPA